MIKTAPPASEIQGSRDNRKRKPRHIVAETTPFFGSGEESGSRQCRYTGGGAACGAFLLEFFFELGGFRLAF